MGNFFSGYQNRVDLNGFLNSPNHCWITARRLVMGHFTLDSSKLFSEMLKSSKTISSKSKKYCEGK
jgi:hypothetical protein